MSSCDICLLSYEAQGALCPLLLTECGHTFCTGCLTLMRQQSSDIRCPTCRKITNAGQNGIESLRRDKNFALLVDPLVADPGEKKKAAEHSGGPSSAAVATVTLEKKLEEKPTRGPGSASSQSLASSYFFIPGHPWLDYPMLWPNPRLMSWLDYPTLYHQTDADCARSILESQTFKCGDGELVGLGIYFAASAVDTGHKAHKRGRIILKARSSAQKHGLILLPRSRKAEGESARSAQKHAWSHLPKNTSKRSGLQSWDRRSSFPRRGNSRALH
jgi:hypothetical protein